MLLSLVLVGDREVIARFDEMPRVLRAVLKEKITSLALALESRVKAKLSGPVLHRVTSALYRSIFHTITESGDLIEGRVQSSGDVKYARIHEFGGTTPPHDILPNKAKALAFVINGKQVFAKIVHHPGSRMPERSFLRSSFLEMREEISQTLRAGAVSGARQALGHGDEP